MEEEKNRRNKRNKKKKNKQSAKPTESATDNSRESASNSQSNVVERGEDDHNNNNNNNNQVLRATDELEDVGEHMDADKEGTVANCSEGKNLAEAKESFTLDRETSFLEKIKELQAEKDAYTMKEVLLEEKIRQLLKGKDENDQKEASQKVEIQQLHDEKYASVVNETSLKNKLMQLEKEKNALIQEVDNLQQKNEHLLREMDAYLEKEASLQAKTQNLEAEKKLWIQKENSAKETVAKLTNDKAQLQAQVMELEQARETLSEEKEELKEIISSLRLRITNLESSGDLLYSSKDNKASEEVMNYKIEAAQAPVEKLAAENSELVEKVNKLYAELDQRGFRETEHFTPVSSVHGPLNAPPGDGSSFVPSSDIGSDDRHGTDQATDSISEISSKMVPISGSNRSLEDVMVEEKRNGEHMKLNDGYNIGITTSEMEAGEIVQIPLVDENVVKESNLEQVAENDENGDNVPLTDAPLIGAPFRLISFVARYVSGADLVNKNAGR